MNEPPVPQGSRAPLYILMILVLLWSAALAAGFAWAATESGAGRAAAYYAVSAFMSLLAVRTAYELWRRLTRR